MCAAAKALQGSLHAHGTLLSPAQPLSGRAAEGLLAASKRLNSEICSWAEVHVRS